VPSAGHRLDAEKRRKAEALNVDLSVVVWRKSSYGGGDDGQRIQIAAITSHEGWSTALYAIRDFIAFLSYTFNASGTYQGGTPC
jgi:hypothetical protein